MSEDFSEASNKSIWALIKHLIAIVDVLKNELPFDGLTPTWHVEDDSREDAEGRSWIASDTGDIS